jgi:putative sigma-54 modulation protein
MQTPVQLTFRRMTHSDALAAHLRQRAENLEHLFDRIVSCHIVVETSGNDHHHGNRYHCSIHVGLPGHEVLVTHGPPTDHDHLNVYATADRAFDDVEHQVAGWVKRQREHRHDRPVDPVSSKPSA